MPRPSPKISPTGAACGNSVEYRMETAERIGLKSLRMQRPADGIGLGHKALEPLYCGRHDMAERRNGRDRHADIEQDQDRRGFHVAAGTTSERTFP